MATYYAMKRADEFLWKGKLTREEVLTKLESKSIGHQWQVCPLGEADRAITGENFIDYPDLFERQNQLANQCRNERVSLLKTIRKPILHEIGKYLISIVFLIMFAGNILVRMFFRDQLGQGVPPKLYYFLVPLWSTGGFGIFIWFIGRLQYNFIIYQTLKHNRLLDKQIRQRVIELQKCETDEGVIEAQLATKKGD